MLRLTFFNFMGIKIVGQAKQQKRENQEKREKAMHTVHKKPMFWQLLNQQTSS
jgi:hypothetical protein